MEVKHFACMMTIIRDRVNDVFCHKLQKKLSFCFWEEGVNGWDEQCSSFSFFFFFFISFILAVFLSSVHLRLSLSKARINLEASTITYVGYYGKLYYII